MSNDTKTNIISEATPVRIGLIITFLGLFGSAIYWGASINTKLDSIIAFQKNTDTTMIELKAKDMAIDKDLSEIKLKLALSDVEIKAMKDRVFSKP